MKFKRRKTLKHDHAERERQASQFIPYDGHITSSVVITKKKELVSVIKMQGFSFETADDEDVDMKKSIRNTLFKSVASAEYSIWVHTVRRKIHASIDGEFKGTFGHFLNEEWKRKHSDAETYINDIYMTIIRTEASGNFVQSAVSLLNKAVAQADKELQDIAIAKGVKQHEELINRMIGSLKDYKPYILGIKETERGTFSEILEFFGTLVNCGAQAPILVPATDVSKCLCTHRLYFGKRAIESRSPTGKSKFAGVVSVKEYANYTNAGMMDAFLQLPFELIVTQVFQFANRQKAINDISMHQRRMRSGGDKAISQTEELTMAMDMASSGHIAFGEHTCFVLAMADNLEELEANLSLVYGEFVNIGITPFREQLNMQPCYWGMLPANFGYLARASRITTMNYSGFSSFHNYPVGKKERNHWGKALTVLDTTSGTPYYFNFHVRDVGHSMIIGPTGAGKTVMMNFLMAQAQKYDCRMFFFDKDRGAEIFIRALGGKYSVIEPSGNTGFNPLLLEDSHANRTFLAEWMRTMALASHDVDITPEENDMIAFAVDGNYKMPKEQRMLQNIAAFFGLETPGSLARRLKIWHSKETHAGLFDNPTDNVDFATSLTFGFEMAKVLADGISINSVLLYLFHKINLSLDGTPTVIVLDEAWALIDNKVFAPKIKDWLKVLRKLNAMVVFATQSVEDISKSTISDTLVQQTATQIYLPNNKATAVYQDVFMLSNREFALIRTTDPGTRYFLVKQNEDSVVARIDLTGMTDIINVLSGRASTVLLLDKVRAEFGDDPDVWLPVFVQRVREL